MILDKIVEATKIRVAQEKQVESPEAVKAAALALPSDTGFPFEAALRQQDFNFICEVKKASPSKRHHCRALPIFRHRQRI